MKLKNAISELLKILGYFLGVFGGFGMINTLGALELDNITIRQFFINEFISFVIFISAFIVYYIRKNFKRKYIEK
jgi:hypothetical protein